MVLSRSVGFLVPIFPSPLRDVDPRLLSSCGIRRVEASSVRHVERALHGLAFECGDIGGFASLVADYDVKLDAHTCAKPEHPLLRSVACHGAVVNEDVLTSVAPSDEVAAVFYAE
ncbi:hypothetical protein MRX96_007251 [Rhipicephalus microplus]